MEFLGFFLMRFFSLLLPFVVKFRFLLTTLTFSFFLALIIYPLGDLVCKNFFLFPKNLDTSILKLPTESPHLLLSFKVRSEGVNFDLNPVWIFKVLSSESNKLTLSASQVDLLVVTRDSRRFLLKLFLKFFSSF